MKNEKYAEYKLMMSSALCIEPWIHHRNYFEEKASTTKYGNFFSVAFLPKHEGKRKKIETYCVEHILRFVRHRLGRSTRKLCARVCWALCIAIECWARKRLCAVRCLAGCCCCDRWAVIWLGGPIQEITPFSLDDPDKDTSASNRTERQKNRKAFRTTDGVWRSVAVSYTWMCAARST